MTDTRSRKPWGRRAAGVAAMTVGVGIAAALPAATASAAPAQCNPQARAAVRAETAPRVAAVLARHPDLAAELAHLKTLPKDQRKSQFHTFAISHRQEVKELHVARTPLRDYRKACHAH